MRPCLAFLVLFFLVSFGYGVDARRCPGDYWKNMMKNEPIPQAISGLFNQGHRFVRDFDIKPNLILYHSDADFKGMKPHAKAVKMGRTDNAENMKNIRGQQNI